MGDAMFLKYFSIFLISMVPLIELRGAIPIALGMGLDAIPSIVICAVGNMLPVPIIYLFAHRFLLWGLDKPVIGPVCRFFHEKGEKAGKRLLSGRFGKYGLMVALTAFVGIPIPGTGAWTGTLAASILDMGFKKSVLACMGGVLLAGFIMGALSLLGVGIFTAAAA